MQFSVTKGSSEMSHEYFYTRDNTATGEKTATVDLSNSSHEYWQENAGLHRLVRRSDTGELERRFYHTTIHDTEPLSMFACEFEEYLEKAQKAFGENPPSYMKALWDFLDFANAVYQETGEEPVIFFY